MLWGTGHVAALHNIRRATRGKRFVGYRIIKRGPPCGPKLLRGRGWKRRRRVCPSFVRFMGYLLFAIFLFMLVTHWIPMTFAGSGVPAE